MTNPGLCDAVTAEATAAQLSKEDEDLFDDDDDDDEDDLDDEDIQELEKGLQSTAVC